LDGDFIRTETGGDRVVSMPDIATDTITDTVTDITMVTGVVLQPDIMQADDRLTIMCTATEHPELKPEQRDQQEI
jgi:hypothetical protein